MGSPAVSRPAELPYPPGLCPRCLLRMLGAGYGGHGTLKPLREVAACVLGADRHPGGWERETSHQRAGQRSQGNAWEGMHFCRRGERAGIPLAPSQATTTTLLPSVPRAQLAPGHGPRSLPALRWGQDSQLWQGRSWSSSSSRCPQGFCLHLLRVIEEAI